MDIKSLREEYSQLHAENDKLITTAFADGKRGLKPEEREAQDKRYARMDEIKSIVEEQKRNAGYAFSDNADDVVKPVESVGRTAFNAERNEMGEKFSIDAIKRGLNNFGKTGVIGRELYALTSGTTSGVFLPKEVLPPVLVRRNYNAIRAALAAYGLNSIEIPDAQQISLPLSDDTGNIGQAQSEGATSGTTADPSLTNSLTLNPTLYSSKQLFFSNTMIAGQSFDIVSYALPVLAKRLDKAQESAWTTTLLGATTGKTTASASVMTYAEVLAWEHSLKPEYRTDGVFIVSDTLYQILRGIVDSNGRPIMDNDPQNIFQSRLHNKPIFVSDYFQTYATGHKSGAFCSAEALKVLDAMGGQRLQRYVGVPANPDQTGFELFANGDFNFDPNGARLLVQP